MKTKFFLLILNFYLLNSFSFGQKAFYETEAEVAQAAIEELNVLMKDEKFLKKLSKEKIRGSYTFQITVREKGMIASMFFIEKSEDADISGQNFLNNLVRNHKFTFKVPKGKYYKFTYTFHIS